MPQTVKGRGRRLTVPASATAAIVSIFGTGSGAVAEQWRITPRVEVEQVYTDNVRLAPKGQEQSDFITTASPGVSVRGDGRRLQLNFDYDPQAVYYWQTDQDAQIRQRFRGFGNAELIEQLLFFDANASVSQQFVNNQGAVGVGPGSTLSSSDNVSTVQTYSLGPSLRNHWGSFADTELRYRYSAFLVEGSTISNFTSNEIAATARSGRDFTDLSWQFAASHLEGERSGGGIGSLSGTSSDRDTVQLDSQYAINSMFSLLGGIGYERIDDPTLLSDVDGVIWNAGFQVKPNRVSVARLTYGRRFNGSNWNAETSYQLSPTAFIGLRYLETIQTSAQQQIGQVGQIGVDPLGRIINTQTGLPFLPGDPLLGLTNAAFRQERFSVNGNLTSGRNRYSGEVFYEKREFETQAANDTKVKGLTANWSRSLTPLLDFTFALSYAQTDFETIDRQDDYYTAVTSLSYRLSQTAQARLSYRHTDRRSDAASGDLVENFVAVTLTKSF